MACAAASATHPARKTFQGCSRSVSLLAATKKSAFTRNLSFVFCSVGR
jgi:hypothetical protein